MSRNVAWKAMAAECIDPDKGMPIFDEASAAGAAFFESLRAFKQAQEAEQAAEDGLRDAQNTRRAACDALRTAKRRALRKYEAAAGVFKEQSDWARMISEAADAAVRTGRKEELAMSPAPSEGDAEDDLTEAPSSQVASDAESSVGEGEAAEDESVGVGEDEEEEMPVQTSARRSGLIGDSTSLSSAAPSAARAESLLKRESGDSHEEASKRPRTATPYAFGGIEAGQHAQERAAASEPRPQAEPGASSVPRSSRAARSPPSASEAAQRQSLVMGSDSPPPSSSPQPAA